MKELLNYLEKIEKYNYVLNVLKWEMDTINAKDTVKYINEIMSFYDLEIYKLKVSNQYSKILNKLIKSKEFNKLSLMEKEYILFLKKEHDRLKSVPVKFYEEFNKLKTASVKVWKEAKTKNDYEIFKPYLIKLVNYSKKYYRYINNKENIYDMMLETYEEEMNSKKIDEIVNNLKYELLDILKRIKSKKTLDFTSNENSSKCSNYILNYMGFDMNKGSTGTFLHAFTTKLSEEDTRIAFSDKTNIIDNILTTLHEGGHALFEQNIDEKLKKFKIYTINKNAVHEGAARFYENMIGRNINFYKPIYSKIDLDISIKDIKKYITSVKSSLIRTEADEITYLLHIIIRYEIEKEIFNNNIDLNLLPELWKQKYKDYLGVEVKNDSEGILQDVHWADASFGYFPSYLLGNVFDGMLYYHIENKLGSINNILKKGKIVMINDLMKKEIFRYGGTYNINKLSKKIFKEELNPKYLIKYFKDKYKVD